jgi:uncharacterized protein YjiS (DUF1127 family)
MPPQETNLTSRTRDDAAELRLNAFAEKEAAGRLAASMRSILSSLKSYWRVFQERRKRERLRVSLHHLTERELADIGLTRNDIDYIVVHRAIERLREGQTYRWLSRGLM